MNVLDFQSASTISKENAEDDHARDKSVSLATFCGFDSDGKFLVDLKEGSEIQPALSTIGLTESDVGIDLVVSFLNNEIKRPVIIGRIQKANSANQSMTMKMDGERIVLRADRDIELRCGEASIVLTRAGKVLIKGSYVLTKSSGANKIKGAYVDIN